MASSNDQIDVHGDLKIQWLRASAEFAKDCDGEKLDQKANPEQILAMISTQRDKDDEDSVKRRKYQKYVGNTIVCLQTIGVILDQAASMFFGPSDMCMNAVSFFVQAAMAYKKIFSDLDSLWETISNALERFSIYMNNQSIIDVGMKKIANQILIQFVDVCKLSRKILSRNWVHQVKQMASTALFRSNAGVGAGIEGLTSLVTKETQTRDTYGYIAIKDTQRNVTEGLILTNQGLNQANDGIAEVKGMMSKNNKKRHLSDIEEKLGKPVHNGQWSQYSTYTLKILPHTGNWISSRSDYQSWFGGDTVDSPLMFLSGDESCGKTYLISAIIQDLLKHYPQGKEDMNRISVAYYYFKQVESGKREDQTQNCTIHMALRTLAYQVAENDPIYRNNVAGLENNEVISTANILELWSLIFEKKADYNAKIYFIIDGTHELEESQLAELGDVLKAIASQSSANFSIRAMIAGRAGDIKTLLKKLVNAPPNIDVAAHNGQDILNFVRREIDQMSLLKQFDTLREDICKSLTEIAKGTFGHIELLLQQIRTKRRQDEIRELLEKAKKGSFHDSIADVIEEGNQKLSDMDIDDLNQLLEWTLSTEYPCTLQFLETILQIRRKSQYLVPLYDRLKAEFSGFFTINPDRNHPETSVNLISDQIREYFKARSESDENNMQLSENKISKIEIGIVQRFLKNLCDDALYQKFEFDQFFKQKAGATSRIYVDTEEMHANVALDCLKVLLREPSDEVKFDYDVVNWLLPERLESADLSYLGPKLKSKVGKRLVTLFTKDEAFPIWQTFDDGCRWFISQGKEDAILKWFRDTAAMKSIPVDERAWVNSVIIESDKEQRNLLEKVAKAAAKAWLVGNPGNEKGEFSMVSPHRFLRGYRNKTRRKENPSVPRLTESDYYEINRNEDVDGLLAWAKEQIGMVELTYSSCYRVAQTYLWNENYVEAETMFQRAISPQDDDAYQARCALAKLYADDKLKLFPQAIETMSLAVDKLNKRPTLSKEQQTCLRASLIDIAIWKKRTLLYDDAMEIYQELLEKDPMDYEIVYEVLLLWADRDDLKQALYYLDELQSQTDNNTRHDRLTQLLLTRADDEETHNIINFTAKEFCCVGKIQENYENAIQIAEKSVKDEQEDSSRETVLYLKHSLANSIHRHNDNGAETLKAIHLWEDITTLEIFASNPWSVIRPLRTAASRICLHYLAEARVLGTNSSAAEQYVAKVRNCVEELSKRPTVIIEEKEMKALLGYHFAVVGQKEQAKEELKSTIEVGIGLLSDSDDTNDYQGYMELADGFMRFLDDGNALAAWSLIGPVKNLPHLITNGELSNCDSVAKPAPNEPSITNTEPLTNKIETASASIINTTEPEAEVKLATHPRLERRETSGLAKNPTEKPSGPVNVWCDCGREVCEARYTFADNWYSCRQCIDVLFAPECFELLQQGKLRRHVCDKSHDFLHVPPWDYEKAKRIGKGNVQVGERVITIKAWLDEIRRDWDIKGTEG